jgi:hypothetical protein
MPIMPSPRSIHHSSATADVERWKIAQQVYVKYIDFAGLIKVHLTENAVRWGDQTIITTRKYEAPEMYGTENPEAISLFIFSNNFYSTYCAYFFRGVTYF